MIALHLIAFLHFGLLLVVLCGPFSNEPLENDADNKSLEMK